MDWARSHFPFIIKALESVSQPVKHQEDGDY